MTIDVDDTGIDVIRKGGDDYFSLTDMIRARISALRVSDWLRRKKTLEMLFSWESVYNENFNWGEFAAIMNWNTKPGSPYFKIGVKDWVARTNAIGLLVLAGRYGGTYARREIALEFAGWVDPFFKQDFLEVLRRYVDGKSRA